MFQFNTLFDIIFSSINLLYLITVFGISVMLILENRSPVKSISWVLVLIFFPIVGLLAYVFFGQNVRKNRSVRKRIPDDDEWYSSIKNIRRNGGSDPLNKVSNLLFNNNNAGISSNNSVQLLVNGEASYASMLESISAAENYVHLEFYAFDNDETGRRFIDLLAKKVKEGIKVRLLVDDVGSWQLKPKFFKELKGKGIEVFPFFEVRFPFLTSRINYRNHRKILVVDGLVAFTGGLNVANRYINGSPKVKGIWRDTHIKITGEAAVQMDAIFCLDWFMVTHQKIEVRSPMLHENAGLTTVQVAIGNPTDKWKVIEQAYMLAISNAKHSVIIETPYFLPPEPLRLLLKSVALSGVEVILIVPEDSDAKITHASTLSYVREMIESGVKVYRYSKGFIHSKLLVIDDDLSVFGSINFDFRSFEYNFEIAAFCYDNEITLQTLEMVQKDISHSNLIELASWRKRPIKEKLKESFARLFSPLM